jgi:AcrR family transcriptional regulator
MQGAIQEPGRARQKRRMRTLLLRTAAELVDKGGAPSVTEVADAAEVSRRTAYRYFPTQEQLLTEIALERLRPQVDELLRLAARRRFPAETLDAAIASIQQLAIRNGALLRTIVRLSLEKRLGGQSGQDSKRSSVRGSRRVDWIQAALAPARSLLNRSRFERLVSGVTLCLGVEPLIVLQDVRALKQEQAVDICRWAAQAMLEASLRDQSAAPSKSGVPAVQKKRSRRNP